MYTYKGQNIEELTKEELVVAFGECIASYKELERKYYGTLNPFMDWIKELE